MLDGRMGEIGTLVLVLCGCSPCATFVLLGANTTDLSGLPGTGYRWTTPELNSDDEGLGGGLAWVTDPDFCADLITKFPEESVVGGLELEALRFVSCTDIYDAIQRGFDTWQANHKLIRFTEITESKPCTSRSSSLDDGCPWELYLTTDDGEKHPDLAAYVASSSASELQSSDFSPLRSPAGDLSYGSLALRRSVMHFQTHICWYLDATFCYGFQQLEAIMHVDMGILMRASLFSLFSLSCTRVLLILAAVTWIVLFRIGPTSRCTLVLDYLSTISPISTLFVIFFCIFPPVFYDRIFLPCWECYDFEAVVAHEVGHVLGFGHPNTEPSTNMEQHCRIDASSCHTPFRDCAQHKDYSSSERSIMHSLTQRQHSTCLSASDMAGIYFLYPVCDDLMPEQVSCFKPVRLSGWLRLASVIGLPFLFAVLFLFVPLTCLRRRDRRKLKQLHGEVTELNNDLHQTNQMLTVARLRQAIREGLPVSRPGSSASRPRSSFGRVASVLVPGTLPPRTPSGQPHGAGSDSTRAEAACNARARPPPARRAASVEVPPSRSNRGASLRAKIQPEAEGVSYARRATRRGALRQGANDRAGGATGLESVGRRRADDVQVLTVREPVVLEDVDEEQEWEKWRDGLQELGEETRGQMVNGTRAGTHGRRIQTRVRWGDTDDVDESFEGEDIETESQTSSSSPRELLEAEPTPAPRTRRNQTNQRPSLSLRAPSEV